MCTLIENANKFILNAIINSKIFSLLLLQAFPVNSTLKVNRFDIRFSDLLSTADSIAFQIRDLTF